MSKLAKTLIQEAKESGSKNLDLGKCGLKEIPNELFDLKDLEVLILSNQQVDNIDLNWIESKNDGEDNSITSIPKEVSNLQNLRELYLGGFLSENWGISEISSICKLSSLEVLDLGSNEIRDIAPIYELKELRKLNLSANKIEDISSLETLKKLEVLDLRGNRISDISSIQNLIEIQILDLRGNRIKNLKSLRNIPDIKRLFLGINHLDNLFSLSKLTSLQELGLEENHISEISPLKVLVNLKRLYLHNNKIQDLSPLKELNKLVELSIYNNRIKDLRPLIPLIKSGVPVSSEINVKHSILLSDNPLKYPPVEIAYRGTEAVLNYFEEFGPEGLDELYEAKLLLVGEGGVGKTSLSVKLKNRNAKLPEPNDHTRGIEISQLPLKIEEEKDFNLHIWDFGGQDIYHSTHRFFLTRRSLYVLITETRRQDDNFDYWIPNIRLFGGKSPIIVVKNRFNGLQRQIGIGRFRRNDEFNIKENIIEVNLVTNEGLEKLEKIIKHHASSLPHIGDPIPKSWIRITRYLKFLSKSKPYISFEKFLEICKEQGVNSISIAKTLGEYLHDLGVVLWYSDLTGLKEKVILRPEWATRAVYRIIDDEKIQKNGGNFDISDVKKVWDSQDYIEMQDELLSLMTAFKLCFKKKYKDEYLIPSLLPPEPSEAINWTKKENLTLQYEYSFMPKGIINQLTAQLHRYIKDDNAVWGRGALFENDQVEALIVENRIKNLIEIRVRIKEKNKSIGLLASNMMSLLVNEMDDIHGTYPGIDVIKKIPCICKKCIHDFEPELFENVKLIEKFARGKSQYYCNKGDEFVNIEQLLFRVGVNIKKDLQSDKEGLVSKGVLASLKDYKYENSLVIPQNDDIIQSELNQKPNSNISFFRTILINIKPWFAESAKWHQKWWVERLGAALASGIIVGLIGFWYFDFGFFDGFFISFPIITTLLFSLGNPKRRYYKAALIVFGSAISSLLFNIQGSFTINQTLANGKASLVLKYLSEYDWLIAIFLIMLSGWLFFLDFKLRD